MPLALALAAARGRRTPRVPRRRARLARRDAGRRTHASHLVVLDALATPTALSTTSTRGARARSARSALVRAAAEALREGTLSALALVVPGARPRAGASTSTPRDLLKFWRRARPLTRYA